MPQNLEVKIKTDNHQKIIEKLKLGAAEDKGLLKQKDIYYQFKKGLLKLRLVNGEYQLVKYNRDEVNPDRWSDYHLLFLTGEDVESYLADLFPIEAIVEKERGLYIYKNTRIHLDSVKNLGNYLELETVVTGSQEEAKKEFDEVVELLELDLSEQIKTSYRFLVPQNDN